MKKILIRASYVMISSLFITGFAFGQNETGKVRATAQAVTPFATTASVAGESVANASGMENINRKAIADFAKKYKNASAVKWYATGKVNVASFKDGEKQNTVVYLNNGKWLHTMINYNESGLPENIRDLVNKKFSQYSIAWVTEVHEGDMLAYFVKIENAKAIRELIVHDGEIAVTRNLVKPE